MRKKQDRGSRYHLGRLKRDFPKIYEDYVAGVYKSIDAARRAAGLLKPRTRLQDLKRHWPRASADEQEKFLKWIGYPTGAAASASTRTRSRDIVGADGFLLPDVVDDVCKILDVREIRQGDALREMGYLTQYDTRLASFLNRKSRPQPDFQRKLRDWIARNRSCIA